VEGTDGLFLVTEWNELRKPDLLRVRRLMRQPVVFDGRNVFEPRRMRELGFIYFGIGRST
jgi:UDPglucose 6-dehydrogenase